ncbi:MAG: hypothetical protein M3541_15050 [Acidobacteriota bacterium]|nr:metallophosphoesterase [Acidobacteriota bacterium]MDQ3420066.1 hypothetical protein [Acidobacteriota bacterium]
MLFGALGDIHGAFEAARGIMERHREVPFWLCVGDVADPDGRYETFPAPLYWIKGNNENFDLIEQWMAGGKPPPHTVGSEPNTAGGKPYTAGGPGVYPPPSALDDQDGTAGAKPAPHSGQPIPNGTLQTIDGLRVAGLGGTFAPTMYELPASELPHPKKSSAKATELADRRRHFVREEVDRCKAMSNVDIFLSHEAPRPFRVDRGIDAGKTPINEVLAAMKPRLHLFGHHHRFVEAEVAGVRSVCLDLVSKSYLLIDRHTLEYQHLAVK